MADFCQQCSVEIFQKDYRELANLCKEGELVQALCENCGSCIVNHNGTCIMDDSDTHKDNNLKILDSNIVQGE